MRKIWATEEPWPFSDATLAQASAAGASETIQIPCAALPTLVAGFNEVDDGQAENVRRNRDDLLAATDWRVIKAYENGQQLPTEWAAYRQALRDVPEQQGFPDNVIWPIEPA